MEIILCILCLIIGFLLSDKIKLPKRKDKPLTVTEPSEEELRKVKRLTEQWEQIENYNGFPPKTKSEVMDDD